jgi:hypothetical protein
MSLTEPHTVVPLCTSLSLNDLPAHCPRPDLNRSMSLPSAKKRLQFFRRDSLKRRKIAHDEDTVQRGDGSVSPSVVSPEAIVNKDQSTVPAVRRTPSPTRRKFDKLLSQTSKLFSLATHRNDSVVLTSEDTRNGLQRTLEDANQLIASPHGEVLPAYVIDDFFKLNSAGGSDWQQSWQWEAHLDRWEGHKTHQFIGGRHYCNYCKALKMNDEGHELPPPYVSMSPPASSRSSSFDHDSASEPRGSEDSHLSISLWPPSIRRRIAKGKETASDEIYYDAPHEVPVTPRTEALEQHLFLPRACVSDRELVRRSISTRPIDLHQTLIPLAFNPSKDCTASDLSDPSYLTARSYRASPIQKARLPTPLSKDTLSPPAPELKPAQRHTPIPGSFKLGSRVEPSSDTPPSETNPSVAEVIRGGFRTSITLVNTSSTTAQDAMSVLLNQYHHVPAPAKLQKRRPRYQSPSPDSNGLPTPPESRTNSDSHQSVVVNVPEVTFGATGSLPARPAGPRRRTTDFSTQDMRVCTLSDTTGSPLPECRTYADTVARKNRKNEEARRRQWPGIRFWRYRTES